MKIEAKPIIKQHVQKKSISRTSSTTTRTSRKVSEDTTIYGEEIFVESIKKEREVAIHFSDFNKHNLRFSDDGEFVIGYEFIDCDTEIHTLYHCVEKVEFSDEIAELESGDKISKFEFSSIYEVRDQISSIIKDDLWQEKQEKVKNQLEADRLNDILERERREKEELELEKADEEFVSEIGAVKAVNEETVEPSEVVVATLEVVEETKDIVKIEATPTKTPTFFKPVINFKPIIKATEETKEEVKPKFTFNFRKDKQ